MDFKKGEVENLAGELWVDPRTHELLQLGVDKTSGGMTKPPQRGWKWMTDLSAKIVKYFYVNLKKGIIKDTAYYLIISFHITRNISFSILFLAL